MYLAYKYGKKKYRQRQERLAAAQAEETQDAGALASTQPPEPPHTGDTHDSAADRPHGATTNETVTANAPSVATSGKDGKGKSKEELTPEQIAEKKRKRKYRLKVLFALVFPFTLQALDMTIVASALPFIAADFS